jgi:hypothetical protein
VFRFEKATPNVIQYKYRYGDEFNKINLSGRVKGRKRREQATHVAPAPCYKSQLPISSAKKQDLLSLCSSGIIPHEHHSFYRNLPSSKTHAAAAADKDSDSDISE